MSGITEIGSILICAGKHRIETSSGEHLNVDRPIGREMADLIEQTIDREGLTPAEVRSVEFRGEGPPIIGTMDDYMRREHERIRAERDA